MKSSGKRGETFRMIKDYDGLIVRNKLRLIKLFYLTQKI